MFTSAKFVENLKTEKRTNCELRKDTTNSGGTSLQPVCHVRRPVKH
jgi:hypothetical protein